MKIKHKHIKPRTLWTHKFINKVIKDKSKYNRKEKHKKNYDREPS